MTTPVLHIHDKAYRLDPFTLHNLVFVSQGSEVILHVNRGSGIDVYRYRYGREPEVLGPVKECACP